jgi:hypothetical protein
MTNVFLWKAGNRVIWHTDLEAAARIDGLSRQPDMTVTEEAFSRAEGLARIIDGEIFLGETDGERRAEKEREVLRQRDNIFAETVDRLCNAARWADLSGEEQAAWIQYRRDLRDITEQEGYPFTVAWPRMPE